MIDLTFVGAAVVAIAANYVVSLIKDRFRRKDQEVWDVSVSSGKREEVRIPKGEGVDVDLMAQELINRAMETLYRHPGQEASSELRTLVDQLERLRTEEPLSPQLHIVLGNAYRNLGDLVRAAGILSEYISRKESAGQFDKDLSNAYYNRACYFVLGGDVERGLDDLKKSFRLRPDNLETAATDADLAAVRDRLEALRS
jgi:tetratricopeptide (TPR) repeat protein